MNVQELERQRVELEKQIAEAKATARAAAIESVKMLVEQNGLKPADIFTAGKRKKRGGKCAVVKFRNGTDQTWAGRGKRPQWLVEALAAGRKLDEFRVEQAAA
jgi:DNA-binding protein H-NS